MKVVVTGAAGNLGTKLVNFLDSCEWVDDLVAIDVIPNPRADRRCIWAVADLSDPRDDRWLVPVKDADAIVHYAAINATSRQSWADAAKSFDMTLNLLEAVGSSRSCRFVFASTNHVMGGYKDMPIPGDGKLRASTPPSAGTRYHTQEGYRWGSAYAATKLLGERACVARAQATGARLTAVSIRIGWCMTGANEARTMTADGLSHSSEPPDEERRSLRWFRDMWLSNRDHLHLMERALRAQADSWPAPGIVVAGMSNNFGMPWDIDETRELIGYEPLDDMWTALDQD